jgi:hypothetical protein
VPFDSKVTEAYMSGETAFKNKEISTSKVIDGIYESWIKNNK